MHENDTQVALRPGQLAWVVAALVLLNFSLTFVNIWPTLLILPSWDLSIEAALGVLAVLALWRLRGVPSTVTRRWLAVLWVLLVLGHYIDITTRSLWGRDISLYWDLKLLPDVTAMFTVVAHPRLVALVVLVALAVPLLVYVPSRWAIGRLSDATGNRTGRRLMAGVAVGVLLLWGTERLAAAAIVQFAEPVTHVYGREVAELFRELSGATAHELPPAAPIRSSLSRVQGADVLLIFMESYGAVTWDHPEFLKSLAPDRAKLDADIRDTGRSVVSAFVESTTYGGESWLAHISLLTGTEVRDQTTNMRLMAQPQRDTLVKDFGSHGYKTIAIMPGLTRSWPQGSFYGFQEIYDQERLAYQGPPFGWWDITDQYALARMDQLAMAPQPHQQTFVFFPTISTHAPFTPTPPYQPDWAKMLLPRPYDKADLERAWSQPADWTNLGPGYGQSIAYAYASLGGYLRLRADRDLVMVLVGDHQPAALISGQNSSWEVPIHVIASRPAVLDRLRQHNFRDGLTPQHPSVARLDTLLPVLLDAFGEDEAN